MITSKIILSSGRTTTIIFCKVIIVSYINFIKIVILGTDNKVYVSSDTRIFKRFTNRSLLKSLTLKHITFSYINERYTLEGLKNKAKVDGVSIISVLNYD